MENLQRPTILKAKSLVKNFYHPIKVPILKGVNLEVLQGDTVAIMGRSGEGKSTLLQVLGTLEPACSGYLEIANQKISTFNKSQIRNHNIAFIFQSFHLLEDYTALENVLMPARIARANVSVGSAAYQRGCYLLELVGLADRMHFRTKLLSGGEKQRTSIARALCNDPDLIFADEPSGNLDRITASHIHNLLMTFAHENKKSLIIVTHDQSLADLCSIQYNLDGGILVNK